jgi:hypothetical protein
MDRQGNLVSYGRPVVEHTRQSNLHRVMVFEHYMHLMAREFYAIVDEAAERVRPSGYSEVFAAFVEEFLRGVESSAAPRSYRRGYQALGEAMQRWANCFR